MDKEVNFVSCFFLKVFIHIDTLHHPAGQQTVGLPLLIILHTSVHTYVHTCVRTVRGCMGAVMEAGNACRAHTHSTLITKRPPPTHTQLHLVDLSLLC